MKSLLSTITNERLAQLADHFDQDWELRAIACELLVRRALDREYLSTAGLSRIEQIEQIERAKRRLT